MSKLKRILKKNSGRNSTGQVVVRHQGGRQKRFLRLIDFKRSKKDVSGRVVSIEYDPNRSSDVALIQYTDGEKRYILAPHELKVGAKILSSKNVELKTGNSMQMKYMPIGTVVHNIEITPGKGGQIARGAGTSAIIQAREDLFVHLK